MSDVPEQDRGSTADELGERDVPFLRLLGVELREAGQGRARFEMTVAEHHQRTLGLLHGGVTATLLDTAMGTAALTRAAATHHVVTVQLSVNYVRPAVGGERLVASAEVQHSGRQTAVARGEVRTADGQLVALGTGTFMYVPREPRPQAG